MAWEVDDLDATVTELRGEGLHPPVYRHVIDLDAALGQQLLDVAVGQPVAQVPAHRDSDDFSREPVASRSRRDRTRSDHRVSVPAPHRPLQRNSACHADDHKCWQRQHPRERRLAGSARRTIEKDANVNPGVGQRPKATVKDPLLRAYRRRYFTQPAEGRGWRAFTAKGAMRRAARDSLSLFIRLKQRWELAVAQEEQLRRQGYFPSVGRRTHSP
jgi:hypothetical protein